MLHAGKSLLRLFRRKSSLLLEAAKKRSSSIRNSVVEDDNDDEDDDVFVDGAEEKGTGKLAMNSAITCLNGDKPMNCMTLTSVLDV